ncbi:hypothetical protein AVEN_208410-1 [Araneus ventricosus]|uniref:Uncharacterized protein n=1 Tax=Araneus ventricosus TaxID=182803 RepID=A0A4Y2PI02_ARAVE|nr:hypothetical protein AVEN_208410-1 [Araneus ventricosus]
MEMGWTQVYFARRLDASCSVAQELCDQIQSENLASKKPVPGRTNITFPEEDSFLALSLEKEYHYCASACLRSFRCNRDKNIGYFSEKSPSQSRTM